MNDATVIWCMVCAMLGCALGVVVMCIVFSKDPVGNVYGRWLDRICWVDDHGEWEECRIVAVSHRGAVAVRKVDGDGDKARWIPKYQVSRRVSFLDPILEREW